MKVLPLLFVLFSLPTFATNEQSFISITFDQQIGKLEFRAPAEPITGLTKPAVSDLQKKMQSEALGKFASNLTKMFVFPPELNCEFSPDHLDVQEKMVDGSWNLLCKKDPKGSRVRFHLHKHFPRLKKIEAVSLNKGVQKSATISKDNDFLELK